LPAIAGQAGIMMLIVDAHEDLAYNVLGDGRTYLYRAW